MGGGGGTNTVEKADPWEGQQPYLLDLFGQAQGLYNRGVPEYYPGQTVAPFSDYTQSGINRLYDRGLYGDPSQQMMGNYLMGSMAQPNVDTGMIGQAGMQTLGGIQPGMGMMQTAGQPLTYDQSAAMANYGGGLAGFGGTDPYAGTIFGGLGEARNYYGNVLPGAMPSTLNYINRQMNQPTSYGEAASQINAATGAGSIDPVAQMALAQTASGQMLGSNPFLDQMYGAAAGHVTDQWQNQIMPGINATFGGAGRTGGGIHGLTMTDAAGQVGDTLADLGAEMYGGAYDFERGLQMDAAGQLGQLGLTSQQSLIDAANRLYGTDVQAQLGAAGLGSETFNVMNQADLARLAGGADLYGMGMGAQQSQADLAAQLFSGGLDRGVTAGAGLADIGLQGMGSLNDLYANIGKQQMLAAGMVPSYSGLQYQDIGSMLQAGGALDAQTQALIDADMARHNYYMQAPQDLLSNYSAAIYGMPGGYGTSTTTGAGANPLMGVVGGGLAGAGVGSMALGSGAGLAALGPYAAIGAGLGYLMYS